MAALPRAALLLSALLLPVLMVAPTPADADDGPASRSDGDPTTIPAGDAGLDGWLSLADLIETLPDDVDEDTRRLALDLLADAGGFAAVADSVPGNRLAPRSVARVALLTRIEGVLTTPSGDDDDRTGFDPRAYTRVRAKLPGGISLGLCVERDPGEPDVFDHVVGHARHHRDALGGTFEVTAGDVLVDWGQRLIAGTPSFGGLRTPAGADRVRGYDGAAESVARRGIAMAAVFGATEVRGFAARTRLDAALDDEGNATTIRKSGTHVTEGERAGKSALEESGVGLRVVRWFAGGSPVRPTRDRPDSWRLGVSCVRLAYDRSFVRGDSVRRRFGLEGDDFLFWGVDVAGRSQFLQWGGEISVLSPDERAALITIEGRRGRSRVLLGATAVSRAYESPIGAAPPGSSSGGNCVSSWIRVAYRAEAGWSAWLRGQVTGHPWRTYSDPLPPSVTTVGTGVRARLGRGVQLTASMNVRSEVGSGSDPACSQATRERRERAGLAVEHGIRWRLWAVRSSRAVDGTATGSRVGTGCSIALESDPAGDRLDVGVCLVSGDGSAPPIYAGEAALPGAFGLRGLKGSGAGWYIRARKALPAGMFLTARAARPASGEELTLGLALEAGTGDR